MDTNRSPVTLMIVPASPWMNGGFQGRDLGVGGLLCRPLDTHLGSSLCHLGVLPEELGISSHCVQSQKLPSGRRITDPHYAFQVTYP